MRLRVGDCCVVTSDGCDPAMPVDRSIDVGYGHLLVTVAVALHRLPGAAQKAAQEPRCSLRPLDSLSCGEIIRGKHRGVGNKWRSSFVGLIVMVHRQSHDRRKEVQQISAPNQTPLLRYEFTESSSRQFEHVLR